ncbi:MAG: prephenate dehydrogenase/arogenate dehydrogenase family protein [Thermoplasmata archaeon]|nr:prephenate dehydrogenase/arogenate dehydrogenase family protein [Thermoplasmata archaeon]
MSPLRPSLEQLRKKVDQADREIAAAIGRRLDIATAIGLSKSRSSAPLRDYVTEERVLARWQTRLTRAGVARPRSAALARWLIEESLRVQESIPPAARPTRSSGSRVGVIGGAGGMGRWLDEFLTDTGHEVRVVDPKANPRSSRTLPSVEAAMDRCEIVAFATPIRSTAPLMERALSRPARAVVFDVLSVKAPIVPVLQAAARKGRLVTSAHPMFGPSARTLSGRNLLLVSCGVPEADHAVRALFSRSALTLTAVPLERHDQLIAESLGLAHAVNLLFLSALASDPLPPPDLAAAASTTFHRQSSLAAAVAQEGPELYLDIQSLNPHSAQVYAELREALDRLAGIVRRRDLPQFRELLKDGRAKLEPGPEPMRA